ncbi:type I-E CRISPR-associated endonuclease Cas1e [Brockia lithotrophica]|uniref:CRISPR-associated endonuclease Cas1 n=1 Tax=Brockia lithotrophica TaxID=933949 RepID=A0A660KU90_9BACL|nr:type I-E CRISPR-associated endonuclease Cas1e [Brockia lithotrophica]RKQ84265.1 CRISPR-associated Cas1 family protein [Brockia lithotrophica]
MSQGSFLSGRLGLAGARIPHADRHGLLWLSRGQLYVQDGTLIFSTAGSEEFDPGVYQIPYQMVSIILLGPGTSITHDVLRILARHGTLLAAVGEGGVKFYTAPPMGQGRSDVARAHARLWADEKERNRIARKMYSIRFQEDFPERDISTLRGMEGGRLRESYRIVAQKYGIEWKGRRYDRENPETNDIPNQSINHASTFVEAAADVAVAAVGALPPLGFIHEDSSNAFTLDIADLWRVEVTLPLAFSVAARALKDPGVILEKEIRYEAAKIFKKKNLIPKMIDQIKGLLHVDDNSGDS